MIGTSSHNCLWLCSSIYRLWNLLSASESLPYNESHGLELAFTCPGLGSGGFQSRGRSDHVPQFSRLVRIFSSVYCTMAIR
jgi:hypothetical protein